MIGRAIFSLQSLSTTPDFYNRFADLKPWSKFRHVRDTVRYRDESSLCKDFILRSSYEKASKRPPSETDSLTALFEVYSSSLTQPAFINTNTVAVLKRRRSPDSFFPCCFSWYTLLGIALLKPNNYFRVIKKEKEKKKLKWHWNTGDLLSFLNWDIFPLLLCKQVQHVMSRN